MQRSAIVAPAGRDVMVDLAFLGQWANKVIEPSHGLPFGPYLRARPPRRQRTLTGPLDGSQDSLWHKFQVFSAVETQQRTDAQHGCAFLSRLPLDVRIIIYEMVLGGMAFHIEALNPNDPSGRLLSWVCRRPDLIYDESPDAHVPCFGNRSKSPSVAHRDEYAPATGLLPLLVSCRLIYSEAIHTLYGANTFEFVQNRTAFRFLKAMIPPQRLKDIRRFKWNVRIPCHPNINPRAARDWSDLFAFFTDQTPSLQHLYIKLQPLYPMQAHILRTSDDAAADWIMPIILMAIDADRRRACKVQIVSNHIVLEPVAIFKDIGRTTTGDASREDILLLACAEMHRRIRLSLEHPT